jgi:hypothetical protein
MASSKPTTASSPSFIFKFSLSYCMDSRSMSFSRCQQRGTGLCTYPGKLYWLFMIHYEHQNQMVLLCVSMCVPLQYETAFYFSSNGNVLYTCLSVRKWCLTFSKHFMSCQKNNASHWSVTMWGTYVMLLRHFRLLGL